MAKGAPLILTPIKAGFPNPAQDVGQMMLDLNSIVIEHPASTFYMRVDGDSMEDLGIYSGDLVVVDKALEPHSGDVIVAFIDGEFTLKQFVHLNNRGELRPGNPAYPVIPITEDSDFQIWGIVTYTVHQFRKKDLQIRYGKFRNKK